MKKGKRVKVVFPIEYRLLILPITRERKQEKVTFFGLRTINEFSSFHYDIIVEPSVSGSTIRLDIRGLRAPQVSIPGSGPAVFKKEFPGLRGTYTLIIKKLEKAEDTYTIAITPDKVVVKGVPEKRFCDVVTIAEEW